MTQPRRVDDQQPLRLERPGRATPRPKRVERRTYTVREAAAILGVGRNSIYEQVRVGAIAALRLGAAGHKIVIPHEAIERMLQGAFASVNTAE